MADWKSFTQSSVRGPKMPSTTRPWLVVPLAPIRELAWSCTALPDGDDHGRPGSGADDSVDHEAVSPLKLPHRCVGSGTEGAVDDQACAVGVQEILQRANGNRG